MPGRSVNVKHRHAESLRLSPASIGGLVGGVVAFVAVDAIVDVLWVAVGVAIGALIGVGIRRLMGDVRVQAEALDLGESMTAEQLYSEAQALNIEGRSTMDRAELAEAIAERRRT